MKRIAVMPGDGIGVEVTREALRVLEALKLDVATQHYDWGADRYLKTGVAVPAGGLEELARFDAILFGAVGDPRIAGGEHAREILLGMRFGLDLYINLRPVHLIDERLTPLKGRGPAQIDFTVFRENTEGLYVGMGGNFKRGTTDEIAINEDFNSRKGVDRILRAAFEHTRHKVRRPDGRKRLCMTDKANALEYAHGLWRRAFAAMQKDYPDVEAQVLYVDVCAMEMVRAPERFDVIVTSNMFGDILTDLGAAIAGGLGLAASANIHPGQVSLFEPVHGSAPDIVGKGLANPLGSILTLALLLDHVGEPAAAARVERAVKGAVLAGQVTRDLGGSLATSACTDAVIARLADGDAAA